jgi:signal transduction histidine kinase
VADLALLQALRHSGTGHLPDALLSELKRRVREHPSFLTPDLLQAADPGNPALRAAWAGQETARTLLREFLRHPMDPARLGEAWLEADTQRFLALSSPIPGGSQVALLPALLVEQAFRSALAENRAQLPPYAAAAVELGGKRWRIDGGIPSPDRAIPLASELGRLALRSGHPFILSLDLAEPELLYAPYRRRSWLTAALILSAAATALLGLVSLWRGFQRQARLSEMRSNFVSSVSHELRAPIAAVQLMAESLDNGRVTGEVKQKDYFRLIVQECRRLSSLVENVLDFSRIDQGRKSYSFEPLDVTALLRQSVELMQPCAAERQVGVVLVTLPSGTENPQPCWDGQAVEQALVNLLDNAIKHSPAGATVKVEVELVEAGGNSPAMVRLWVEDQGEGIPAEEHGRIFELFYRHGSELRRETKGVGIGLSIVKHIAEAHGGRVLVRSAVGQGSRFALELPLLPPASRRTE